MKKLLLTTGLLLLLLPITVVAEGDDDGCPSTERAYNLANADALGHYTQRVLTRVNNGIAKAKEQPGGSDIIDIMNLHFLSDLQSVFYMMVDTDLRSVEYGRDLTNINSCLHYDLMILEAKIEEVRCEILEAYDRDSPSGIRMLKKVASFLNQRYRHLVKGALEPGHVDESWAYYYEFDEPFQGWCCDIEQMECGVKTSTECELVQDDGTGGDKFFTSQDACLTESICTLATDETARPKYIDQCPFDSNYLAPSTSGYGCDLRVLSTIPSGLIPGVDAEVQALRQLAGNRDRFMQDVRHIRDTTLYMDSIKNENILTTEERTALQRFGTYRSLAPEHKRVYGCNADLTPQERNELEIEDGEETNRGTEGELTQRVRPSQEWIRIPLRSTFFFKKDHLEIWKAFVRTTLEWEAVREFPDYLKNPDEFEEEADRRTAMHDDQQTFRLITLPRNYLRTRWEEHQQKQAIDNATVLPKSQDAVLQVRDSMKPVRSAMSKNVELVQSTDDGMRRFAINFAYYLRRSCIYRPCNQKLETIMQILFSNECFPYASGGKGSWKDCAEAVQDLAAK